MLLTSVLYLSNNLNWDQVPNRSLIPASSSVSVTHTITRPIDPMIYIVITSNYLTGFSAAHVSFSEGNPQVCSSSTSVFVSFTFLAYVLSFLRISRWPL